MSKLAIDRNAQPIQVLRPNTTQKNSISGTAVSYTAIPAGTRVARIVATVDCHYALNSTATTSSAFLPFGAIEYIHVYEGDVISIVSSGSTGSAYVTGMI